MPPCPGVRGGGLPTLNNRVRSFQLQLWGCWCHYGFRRCVGAGRLHLRRWHFLMGPPISYFIPETHFKFSSPAREQRTHSPPKRSLLILPPRARARNRRAVNVQLDVCAAGLRPGVARPSAWTAGIIGAVGGFMYAYQSSAGACPAARVISIRRTRQSAGLL